MKEGLLSFSIKFLNVKVFSSTYLGETIYIRIRNNNEQARIFLDSKKKMGKDNHYVSLTLHSLSMISTALFAIIRSLAVEHMFSQNSPSSLLLV